MDSLTLKLICSTAVIFLSGKVITNFALCTHLPHPPPHILSLHVNLMLVKPSEMVMDFYLVRSEQQVSFIEKF